MSKALLALVAAVSIFIVYKLATRAPAPAPVAQKEAPLPPPAPPAENPPLLDLLQGTVSNQDTSARLAELLQKGADPNAVDKAGRPALTWALRSNNVDAIRQLVKAGADVNKRDLAMQWTPLMDAAYLSARDAKYLASLQALLELGADVKAEKDGATALHIAVNNTDAQAKSAPAVEALLQHGADPNGGTPPPLIVSAWTGKMAAALALVKGGASLAAAGEGAKTPAQTARDNKHPELAAALEKLAKGGKAEKKAAKPEKKAAKHAPAKKHHR